MSLSLTEFKDLSAGIQSLVVGLAIAVGGAWALWRFSVLREAQRADLELKKAAVAAKLSGTLHLSLTSETLSDPASQLNYLHVQVRVENVGNRAESLVWEKSPVRFARVLGYSDARPQFEKFSEHYFIASAGFLKGSTLWPGGRAVYHMLLPVQRSGLYFIELLLQGSPQQTDDTIAELSGLSPFQGMVVWSTSTYVAFNLGKTV